MKMLQKSNDGCVGRAAPVQKRDHMCHKCWLPAAYFQSWVDSDGRIVETVYDCTACGYRDTCVPTTMIKVGRAVGKTEQLDGRRWG